jgi:hypothetical protein
MRSSQLMSRQYWVKPAVVIPGANVMISSAQGGRSHTLGSGLGRSAATNMALVSSTLATRAAALALATRTILKSAQSSGVRAPSPAPVLRQ